MAQILHKRAMTTHAIRTEIQRTTESVTTPSRHYGINPKTVRNWRYRDAVEDTRMGPTAPRSRSLTPLEEVAAVIFLQKTLLPLDDCLHALQRELPSLTRSSLHRLQRRGISQLPRDGRQKRKKKSFKHYPIGYLHIDISEVRTGEGKAYLFVAMDRTSKFVQACLYRQRTRQIAADFLEATLAVLNYRVHTVLTDNGVQFAKKADTEAYKPHTFDVVSYHHGIETG